MILDFKNWLSESTSELHLDIFKNPEKAPYLGNKFGQDVEPYGTYVTSIKPLNINYLSGKAYLRNPLFIEVNSDTLVSWKYDLSKKYKAKGKQLSIKLEKEGYDSIITKYKEGDFGEIILLSNAKFILN